MRDTRDKTVQVRVTAQQKLRLEKLAKEQGRTLSDMLYGHILQIMNSKSEAKKKIGILDD